VLESFYQAYIPTQLRLSRLPSPTDSFTMIHRPFLRPALVESVCERIERVRTLTVETRRPGDGMTRPVRGARAAVHDVGACELSTSERGCDGAARRKADAAPEGTACSLTALATAACPLSSTWAWGRSFAAGTRVPELASERELLAAVLPSALQRALTHSPPSPQA